MLNRLVLLLAMIVVLLPGAASARRHKPRTLPSDTPTLFVSKDVMAIRNGRHRLTVRFSDALISLETPYGNRELRASIASSQGWVQPSGVIAQPKTYRARDLVTAVVTLAVADDRRMALRISAYPGVPAIFVKSGVSGLYGSSAEHYFWHWDGAEDTYFAPGRLGVEESKTPPGVTRFDHTDWVFFPSETGGLAVLTNGTIGYRPGQPFIHPLPGWRPVGPGETHDVCFGLAGVASAAAAESLSKTAKARPISILKPVYLTKQARIDYGTPAPEWLRSASVYGGWSQARFEGGSDWMRDIPVIVGVPADKAAIAKAHEAGARVIACVNYAELQNSDVQMRAKGKLHYQPDDATPAELLDIFTHPSWTCVCPDGSDRRSNMGISKDIPGLFGTCFHQADLRNNALTQVLNIMNLGADGVLIENACPASECYGPKFQKHKHEDPYETNTAAYETLQKQIYRLVKSFGEDKVVVHNSGIIPSHWAYCDAQVWNGLNPAGRDADFSGNWSELRYAAEEHAEAIRRGKAAVIASDCSAAPEGRRAQGALYAYAYARLYGFAISDRSDSSQTSGLVGTLHTVKLGKPLHEARKTGELLYRAFENGIVFLNPTASPASAALPVGRSGNLTDIASDQALSTSGQTLTVDVPPQSGRVLLWRQD